MERKGVLNKMEEKLTMKYVIGTTVAAGIGLSLFSIALLIMIWWFSK